MSEKLDAAPPGSLRSHRSEPFAGSFVSLSFFERSDSHGGQLGMHRFRIRPRPGAERDTWLDSSEGKGVVGVRESVPGRADLVVVTRDGQSDFRTLRSVRDRFKESVG
jgi:hypothetical protein